MPMTFGRTRRIRWSLATVATALAAAGLVAQQAPAPQGPPPGGGALDANGLKTWTAPEDRQNMMEQLGITKIRPGPSGDEKAPNHANYDEATANPYPDLPDVLTMKNGKKVTTKAMWA